MSEELEINKCTCGNDAELREFYIKGVANKKNWFVRCQKCRIRTRNRNTPRKAIHEWNEYKGKLYLKGKMCMSKEEKEVLKTFKSGLGLTSAEREILTNYIDKLEKENEELKKDNKMLNEMVCLGGKIPFLYTTPKFTTNENFISKDKIRNKIKELKKLKDDEYIEFGNTEIYYAFLNQIAILNSLLRGDDDNENR